MNVETVSPGEERIDGCAEKSASSNVKEQEPQKRPKQPDSKRFEREIETLNGKIREKEAKLHSLQKPSPRSRSASNSSIYAWKDKDTLLAELRSYKVNREKDIEARQKIDIELKRLTTLVQQKNDACRKAQACLKYKSESKTDEAIRRLEHQLRVQQLKLRDETRIVTEIDALRRSKKMIHEFVALKAVLDQLRDKQRALRTERDICTKRINTLKTKEDEIKNILDEQRGKAEEVRALQKETESERALLKKEIDGLYDQKRALIAAFNHEKIEYFNSLREAKLQNRQRKREESQKHTEEKRSMQQRERATRGPSPPPYQAELALCDTLLDYMERLTPSQQSEEPSQSREVSTTPSPEPLGQAVSPRNEESGVYLKKKGDDDLEGLFAGTAKRSKRESKKNRRSLARELPKKLVLHPAVVDQFCSLRLSPPSSVADIPRAVADLNDKKDFFASGAEQGTSSSQLTSTASSLSEDSSSLSRSDTPSTRPGSVANSELLEVDLQIATALQLGDESFSQHSFADSQDFSSDEFPSLPSMSYPVPPHTTADDIGAETSAWVHKVIDTVNGGSARNGVSKELAANGDTSSAMEPTVGDLEKSVNHQIDVNAEVTLIENTNINRDNAEERLDDLQKNNKNGSYCKQSTNLDTIDKLVENEISGKQNNSESEEKVYTENSKSSGLSHAMSKTDDIAALPGEESKEELPPELIHPSNCSSKSMIKTDDVYSNGETPDILNDLDETRVSPPAVNNFEKCPA
ncbi:uncharacterized protein LOC5509995 [Nematostella vectensis]|nr:uncharacterized protein LOC5509995 [Nematostella vectensis]